MHWIDWTIVALLIGGITAVAASTNKYMRSVADFLSANRCAGKYLLGVADGISALGAISIIALFEMNYKAGFTASWWQLMLLPIGVILATTGWVQYRFRQTRALTMAQFFEIRYSRSFRVFAGMLGFFGGVINFGIFPAVGGRFFQYYCGLPSLMVGVGGGLEIDLVYAAVMAVLLVISIAFTFLGGQITVVVTDFIQGLFVNIVFVVMGFYLLFFLFDWNVIVDALVRFAPEDASLVNPMKTGGVENFNVTYFLIAAFSRVYAYMAWQGTQGYYSSARTPHDARMGRVIGQLRTITQMLPMVLLPVCAFTFLHHPNFAESSLCAKEILDGIGSEQIRSQLTVTVAASQLLPVGLLGLFAAVMLAAFISTHDTYLHSWGSIFIQDVVMPIRQYKGKSLLSPGAHIRWLRYAVFGVGLFIFMFSLLFNQKQDIFMFFALTGTLYLGWAGSAIIGGLYWKRGTTKGVWSAAILSVVLAIVGWFLIYQWGPCKGLFEKHIPGLWLSWTKAWPDLLGDKFPINAQVLFFYTIILTVLTYVIASLIDGKVFNMDRLLHRGKYAVEGDVVDTGKPEKDGAVPKGRKTFFGKEFSLSDRALMIISYGYIVVFFGIFLVGTISMLSTDIPDSSWATFWWGFSVVILAMTAVITAWVCIGGIQNLREMYGTLRSVKRNAHDDGTVVGHQSLSDLEDNEKAE
ncbi:MAG: sodium:solute symporter [Verrucomicrobiota bacterium]